MSVLYSLIKSGKIKVHHGDPIIYRFWKNMVKDGPVHPLYGKCWEWIKKLKDGYGQFQVLGEHKAHRVAYRLLVGEIPTGLYVLHKCDNRKCVRPSHLFLGTQTDNMEDKVLKGRQATGKRVGVYTHPRESLGTGKDKRTVLTDEDVLSIRSRFKHLHKTDGKVALAKEFGVAPMTIYFIVTRRSWKHLT